MVNKYVIECEDWRRPLSLPGGAPVQVPRYFDADACLFNYWQGLLVGKNVGSEGQRSRGPCLCPGSSEKLFTILGPLLSPLQKEGNNNCFFVWGSKMKFPEVKALPEVWVVSAWKFKLSCLGYEGAQRRVIVSVKICLGSFHDLGQVTCDSQGLSCTFICKWE